MSSPASSTLLPAQSTPASSLQLAIDVNAQISAVLLQRDEAGFERLEQARETLGELIDNLEADFMKRTSLAPAQPVAPIKAGSDSSAQQEYMKDLIQLLKQKDEAIERMRHDQEETMRRILQSHEETIRAITREREETNRSYISKLPSVADNNKA